MVNKPLIRPYFWKGDVGGGRLTSHDLSIFVTYEWCRKLLLRLLDVRTHFREGFRTASANTAAASANASSKNLLPRASAAPFLSYFLQYRFREQSASFREACANRKYVDFEFRYE